LFNGVFNGLFNGLTRWSWRRSRRTIFEKPHLETEKAVPGEPERPW